MVEILSKREGIMNTDVTKTLNLAKDCSIQEVYEAIQKEVMKKLTACQPMEGNRKLYYVSAEFLMGKMLTTYLHALHLYDEVEEEITKHGYTMEQLCQVEKEPSLGNGGLGRLAACFLDSIAALGYCGDGIGLLYHFGLFKQVFQDHKQMEIKDEWLNDVSWIRKTEHTYPVYFGNLAVLSRMYEMDIPNEKGHKNTLRLFDIESVDESLVQEGISFDKRDVERNLTLFLYPDDSDEEGRLLRIYQQYFMVSSGAQYMVETYLKQGYPLADFAQHITIQINDTHPTLMIPELISIFMKKGMTMRQAIDVVSKTCAYTNHTILAEALETWPRAYLKRVVPQLMDIIEALDAIVSAKGMQKEVAIIDAEDRVHMAHIDLHYGYRVNGVAALHTQILKESELKPFYQLYPEKFNNKTNGITFRRFLRNANPQLHAYLKELLHVDVCEQPQKLSELLRYQKDETVCQTLSTIKKANKQRFIQYMKQEQGFTLPQVAIFDVQIKRLHEYKRQQMNALYIIHKYLEIKEGHLPKTPIVCIFGAKAAPAYTIAKDIIHLLLCLQTLLANDPEVAPYLQICFVENYNVTMAEYLIPAADVSEQISLASKEASGTGNMKLMLNGAITLGTADGANVEIKEAVGDDNIYIFGADSDTVIQHYAKADYISKTYYEKKEHIHILVDFIVSDAMLELGDQENLHRLHQELINKDWFMTLLDIEAYITCKEQCFQDYEDTNGWNQKMLVNIAKSGFFSSDRTIEEYVNDIWNL